MAYRNGTYISFHANGTDIPTDSDIKYYNLMKAWTEKGDDDFTMINSHEKSSSVRDSSKKATLRLSLQERLRNSRNMVLIAIRINKRTARVIHIPFKKAPIKSALDQFGHDNLPSGSLVYYTRETYVKWGLIGNDRAYSSSI